MIMMIIILTMILIILIVGLALGRGGLGHLPPGRGLGVAGRRFVIFCSFSLY